jgi:hypothetical protein
MDATAWGDWGAAYGKYSWQYSKAVQEVTRIRNARMISPAEIYRPNLTYFPTPRQPPPSHHIPRHQGFGGHPWSY